MAETPTARRACLPSKTVHGQTTSTWHMLIKGSEDPEDTSPCGSPSLPSPARSSCTMGKGGTVLRGWVRLNHGSKCHHCRVTKLIRTMF